VRENVPRGNLTTVDSGDNAHSLSLVETQKHFMKKSLINKGVARVSDSARTSSNTSTST
jgi:hypothetical protein